MPANFAPAVPVAPTGGDDARLPRARFGTPPGWFAAIWPATVVSLLFLALMGVFVRRSLAGNDGHLVYPMDDAYSHMAIARNFLQHGTWGFSAINGFSSGGSSLLWPLLLTACFAVFGVHEWVPLALNVVPVVGLLFYAGAMIRRHTRSGVASLLILLAVMYLTPLPTIAGSGMEHCWQILIALVFLDLAADALARDPVTGTTVRARTFLPLLALLMTMARYEGLFLLTVVGLLLLYRRQTLLAVLCGLAGLLPIVAFGVYSIIKGWHFLPNSLLLKADINPLTTADGFVTRGYHALIFNPHMFVLVLGLAFALLVQWRRQASLWHPLTLLLSILLAGTLVHLQFADVAWFYRYEGYLLALGILFLGLVLVDEVQAVRAAQRAGLERGWHLFVLALAAVMFCAPLWTRAANAWNELPLASHNIYEQQFQMARFVRQSYRNEGVAINDIGAVDFFNNVNLLDLWGLGTVEVANAKRGGTYSQNVVRGLVAKHHVRLIMIDPVMASQYGGPPAEWIPIGRWTIPDNFVCGNATVCFYAPDAAEVPKLVDALQTFAPHLPPGIAQAGYYMGEPLPHVQGVYPAEVDGGGVFYWSGKAAQFTFYPSIFQPNAADVDSTLLLSARSMSKNVTLDVILNGRKVASHHYWAGEVGKWIELSPTVHWREGLNVLTFMSHGGEVVSTPADPRTLLFAVHEPTWTFDEPYEPGPPSDDPPAP